MDDLIVKVVARIVIPFIYLYGIYVIIHGSISPGGSFAGGAIFGSAIVLYTIIFGLEKAELIIPKKIFNRKIEGLLCFVFMAFIVLFMGYDVQKLRVPGAYTIQAGELVRAELLSSSGIGVGLMVAVTLVSLFHIFIKEDKFCGDNTRDNGPN